MYGIHHKIATFVLIPLLLLVPISDAVRALTASPQDQCEEELNEAQQKYQLGRLDEAIELVNSCLAQEGLSLEESEKAYKLLGKAYHAKGLLDQAKQNLRKLIELIPNWRPNPDVDTPSFQRMAEEVIKEMQEEKAEPPMEQQPPEKPEEQAQPPQEQPEPPETTEPTKKGGGPSKALLFVGGGGVLAAVLGLALGGGGGNGGQEPPPTQQLADPPPLPPNP